MPAVRDLLIVSYEPQTTAAEDLTTGGRIESRMARWGYPMTVHTHA